MQILLVLVYSSEVLVDQRGEGFRVNQHFTPIGPNIFEKKDFICQETRIWILIETKKNASEYYTY